MQVFVEEPPLPHSIILQRGCGYHQIGETKFPQVSVEESPFPIIFSYPPCFFFVT